MGLCPTNRGSKPHEGSDHERRGNKCRGGGLIICEVIERLIRNNMIKCIEIVEAITFSYESEKSKSLIL